MANPVLVEVTRGKVVESRHRGAIAVVDGDGRVVEAIGDVERPVFPRSATKAFQALPLIESGAADRYGFGDAELALAISSHNAEPRHVETARAMLARAGLDEGCLECGPQWPERGKDQAALQIAGLKPGRVHNNCSGKHAGFLCTAACLGEDPSGYVKPDHPVMRAVVAASAEMTGAPHTPEMMGVDGCSIPTYAIPLTAIARGFARLATGTGLGPARRAAVERLRRAAAAEPFMVAGTNRFCTRAMTLLGPRAFVKTGAEGVFTAALPQEGLGIAVKIDDGASRASEVAVAETMRRLLEGLDEATLTGLDRLRNPPILDRNGATVGEIRPAADPG